MTIVLQPAKWSCMVQQNLFQSSICIAIRYARCMYKYSKILYKNVNSTFLQKSNTYYIEICPLFIVLYEIFSIYMLFLINYSFFMAVF